MERRLRELELRNFGSHAHTRIPFTAPVTFLIGENNHGKSTIPEALEYALLGSARGINGRGEGTDDLVRTGTTHMRVTASLANLGDIQREVKDGRRRVVVSDVAPDEGYLEGVIHERLQASPALIRAALSPETFLTFAHGDAKTLLLGVLDVRVPIGDEQLTLADLEARYAQAFEDRKLAKKALADHRLPAKPEADPPPPIEELETRLRDLRAQAAALADEGAEARGRRVALTARLDALTQERTALAQRILTYGDPHADLDGLERRLQELEAARRAVTEAPEVLAETKELAELGPRLVDARGRLKTVAAAVDGIKVHTPEKGCVLAADVPCLTPVKEFRGRLTAFEKEITKLQRQIDQAEARQMLLQAAADERTAQTAERSRVALDLERERGVLQNRARDLQTDQARLEEVLAETASIQTDIANCGTVAENPQLEALRLRITLGEQKVPQARALAKAWADYTAAHEAVTQLRQEVERLEQRCEDLGPKGARVQALAAALGAFTEQINESLRRFGYELAFSLEPWQMRVNGRALARLSMSERLRVGLCVQLALAEVSGFNLIVIDNSEQIVSPAARQAFAQIVLGWAVDGRQAIVLRATRPDEAIRPPAGVAVWRVRMDEHGVSSAVCEADGTAAAA